MTADGSHEPHPWQDLCRPGRNLYAQALAKNGVRREAALAAPCALEAHLLVPDDQDGELLRPVPPGEALELLMSRSERAYLQYAADLVGEFQALLGRTTRVPSGLPIFTVAGVDQINERLDHLVTEATHELLTMQPGSRRPAAVLSTAVDRTVPALERGVVMRTLYVHAVRNSPTVLAYRQRLASYPVQIRTVYEVFGRMFVVDDEVAMLSAAEDDSAALEIRHPPIVKFLRRTFDVLWEHGKPLGGPLERAAARDGISPVQLHIARLMVAGNDDQEIAARLGINIRTVRGHVAKLSAALGSNGRTQLGYLLAGAGLLDGDDQLP
ncbi:LuxR C-terminal-related transcriptional regulator [Streptomyces sp. NPDC051940]|uniref:helix-turn-helix transcriptional regulator n=1 Tax=Streptomyces sp. NPDC051940 TaxID=3155675 RepID=UPI0034319B6A